MVNTSVEQKFEAYNMILLEPKPLFVKSPVSPAESSLAPPMALVGMAEGMQRVLYDISCAGFVAIAPRASIP